MNRFKLLPLLLVALLPLPSAIGGDEAGWPALDQALLDLSSDLRVACVAAHPDDEDSETLAWLRRRWGVETWVILGTDGEGGQNEIGDELYEELAAIRREETLNAAKVTGSRVDFLSFPDFGYSKSASETFKKWGREELVRRLVRSIRSIRPHVVVTNHDTKTGHGHHQAIGIALLEAYDAAAEGKLFPEEGAPWEVARLLVRCEEGKADVLIPTGELDPVRGKSYAEIGLEALKEHRSQGKWDWVEIKPGERYRPYRIARSRVEKPAKGSILEGLPVPRPEWLEEARRRVPRGRITERLIALKRSKDGNRPSDAKIDRALALVLGLRLTLTGPTDSVLRGQTVKLTPRLLNGGTTDVTAAGVEVPARSARALPDLERRAVDARTEVAWSVDVKLGGGGPTIRLGAQALLRSHPPVELSVRPWGRIFRRANLADPEEEKDRFFVEVRNRGREPIAEKLVVKLLDTDRLDVREPGRVEVEPGGTEWVRIGFRAKEGLDDGLYRLEIVYGGTRIEEVLRVIDVRIPDELNVGVVTTYGDEVVKFLRAIGIRAHVLTDEDLETLPLDDFNTIYLGIRPYLSRPVLRQINDRLLEYVENGGHLVVNYSKTREWSSEFAPYFIEIGRDRVTEEDAPILLRDPNHRLLNFPNKIRKREFDGWIQERSLYCPSRFDGKRYEVLMACADAGDPPVPGMLFTTYGKGTYVYTTFVWYRQLRILNPAAMKMVANLIGYSWQLR